VTTHLTQQLTDQADRPDAPELPSASGRLSGTRRYVIRRVAIFFFTVWAAVTLSFVFIRLIPGDPISALQRQLEQQGQYERRDRSGEFLRHYYREFGLDGSLFTQYTRYMRNVITRFDFGPSLLSYPTDASYLIRRGLPWTIGLVSISTILAWVLGVTSGALVGWARRSRIAGFVTNICLATSNIPAYLFALWMVFFFAYRLGWFPSNGAYDPGLTPGFSLDFIGSVIHHGALPVLSTALITATAWLIGTRALVVNILGEDFLTYATARGLRPTQVLFKYVMPNTWLPQIQALGLALGGVVGGNVLIEQLFRYPGVGQLLIRAAAVKDVNTMTAVTIMLIVVVLLANLLLDLLLPVLDPRVTYRKR
jgi:peptide/nickel transport system permease protein